MSASHVTDSFALLARYYTTNINKEDKIMAKWKFDSKKTGLFAAGVLFGTAGIKVLSSKDAKKVYTNVTAAVLRAKECVMKTVTTVQENAGDIYAEAKQINEDRAAAEEAAVVEDASQERECAEEVKAEEKED